MSSKFMLVFSKFFQMEKVSVRITADTWVIGIIVGIAHICSKVTIQPREIVRFS